MAGRLTTIPEPYRDFFGSSATDDTEPPGIWLPAKPDLGVRLVVACLWLPCYALPGLLIAIMPLALLLPPQTELRRLIQHLGQANPIEWLLFGGLVLLIGSLAALLLQIALGQATDLYRAWRALRGDRYGVLLTPMGIAARLIDFKCGKERLWQQHNCFWLSQVAAIERRQVKEQGAKGRSYWVSYIAITPTVGASLWRREEYYPSLWPPLERWWQRNRP